MRTERRPLFRDVSSDTDGAAARPLLPLRLRPGWLATLACFFVAMLAIGAIPGEAQALSNRYGDKLLHTLSYGFMALLAHQALRAAPVPRSLITIVIIALLGLFDESLQSLLPYRNASIVDWCFDIGAAAIVTLLLAWPDHLSTTDESDA